MDFNSSLIYNFICHLMASVCSVLVARVNADINVQLTTNRAINACKKLIARQPYIVCH